MPLSERERDRRQAALQRLLEERGYDALLLASNDYRGHKGALRWVTDVNLVHRHGFALVAPGREPEAILPQNLAMQPMGDWPVSVRFPRHTAGGVADALAQLPRLDRLGIVGLGQVMRVEDLETVRARFPSTEITDASEDFERLRAVKSEEELAGVREATYIAERSFERLLEMVRPGVSEREIGAEMYRTTYLLGGEDPLFLSMYGVPRPDGTVTPRFSPPRDRLLRHGDVQTFSFELIGPLGYWMEFARMVSIGAPTDVAQWMNAAVKAGMDAGAGAMRTAARPDEVQRAALDAVEALGGESAYWSGHGLGQDVIEEPWIGLEVVQDRDAESPWTLEEQMVLAMHPFVIDPDRTGVGYMSNAYVVAADGGRPVSDVSLELHVA